MRRVFFALVLTLFALPAVAEGPHGMVPQKTGKSFTELVEAPFHPIVCIAIAVPILSAGKTFAQDFTDMPAFGEEVLRFGEDFPVARVTQDESFVIVVDHKPFGHVFDGVDQLGIALFSEGDLFPDRFACFEKCRAAFLEKSFRLLPSALFPLEPAGQQGNIVHLNCPV